MPPSMFGLSAKPLSGRYLSFAEREEEPPQSQDFVQRDSDETLGACKKCGDLFFLPRLCLQRNRQGDFLQSTVK